jgi:vitellogenic carboxypeptidase-like protein
MAHVKGLGRSPGQFRWLPLPAPALAYFGLLARLVMVTMVMATAAVLAVPAAGAAASSAPSDQVTSLPGLSGALGTQYAGYASVNAKPCSNVRCSGAGDQGLFYWFVGKTGGGSASAPTILWTNGGPGATSFWGFFTENGPYTVQQGGHLVRRSMAWNNTANYLMFDQPLGVGLSFAPDAAQPSNVQQGIDQWYTALVHFMSLHPKIAANPVILAGESYGGTYDALLAKAILDGNAKAGRQIIHLGGVVIAAGWVDPVVQQSMDTTYALAHGLITSADKARLDQTFAQCQAAIAAQTPSSAEANEVCSKIKSSISDISGLYMLNTAKTGDPPTAPMIAYLNRPDVRAAIHAKSSGKYDLFAESIGKRYVVGEQDSYLSTVQSVLEQGVPVMVVSGLNDATDVNALGTGAWLNLLTGTQATAFDAAPTVQWKGGPGNHVLGYIQEGDGLSWVKVLNAGHLTPLDQPLLINLIRQKLLTPAP